MSRSSLLTSFVGAAVRGTPLSRRIAPRSASARLAAALLVVAALVVAMPAAQAGLTLASQFNPGIGQLVAGAFDPVNGTVWVYGGFGADLRQYTLAGAFVSSIPRPGESADDFDLEVLPAAIVLNGTPIPAGTLLVINGESGVAEIYAVDKLTGAVLATLPTAFGTNHVVGGAYHPGRDSFFLVQDKVATGAPNQSLVAEVDRATGAVLGSFKVDSQLPGFTVNYGDIEVSAATGNLWIVSSDETSIAEFTPAGVVVQQLALPAGVSSLSGIGLDDAGGGAWVTSSSGVVSHLGGATWSHLDHALAGSAGLPTLTGSGTLASGAPTTLTIAHAKPLSTAYLILGFAQLSAPFKGGTLVPQPDIVSPALPVSAAGSTAVAFPWPAGIPSGFPLWYQAWIADGAAAAGFAATNGLKSITP